MCLATQIRTDHADFRRHFGARVSHEAFAALYQRRLHDPSIRIPKAIDESFRRVAAADDPIVALIDAYNSARTQDFEQALFAERSSMGGVDRLAASDTSIEPPEVRQRLGATRIQRLLTSIGDTKRQDVRPQDQHVYRNDIAPVAIRKDGQVVVVPMRYRPGPSFEPVTYRHRSGLNDAPAVTHGLLLADAFVGKVALKRDDGDADDDETPQQVELRFAPLSAEPMLLACVWWMAEGALVPDFTILMDLPPPEVARAGHDRCVIPIAAQHVERWLQAGGDMRLAEQILDARVRPFFESQTLVA